MMPSVLPKPSGPFHVGCTDIVTCYGKNRSLFRLFYPAQHNSQNYPTPWVSDEEYITGLIKFAKLSNFSWIARYFFSGRFMPATYNANLDVKDASNKLPVVLFSHGLGSNRTTYSSVCLEMASHGSVVASVEHADESASATYYLEKPNDGNEKPIKKWINFLVVNSGDPNEHAIRNKQVHQRANDCSKVLDHLIELNQGTLNNVFAGVDLLQFKDKLDLDRCSVVGHSFGGGTAITVLSKDKRFKGALGLDSWLYPLDKDVYKKVSAVPILFINAETFQWPANVASMRKLDADALGVEAERKIVTIKKAVHMTHSDILMFFGWNWFTKHLPMLGGCDPVELIQASHQIMMAFMGKHLGLPCGQDLEQLSKIKDAFIVGSNVELDEERVKQSKEALRASL